MTSLSFFKKSLVALGAAIGGGIGISYSVTNSVLKNYLSKNPKQKSEENGNSLTPKDLKTVGEDDIKRENYAETNTLERGEIDPSRFKMNSQNGQHFVKESKSEKQKDFSSALSLKTNEHLDEKNINPLGIEEKEPVVEIFSPNVNELSKNNSSSKSYFEKDERDLLEGEEWSAEECKWDGFDLKIKLQCQWTNGEIYSKSREVIFNFSEKDISDYQLNDFEIRNKIEEINFEPLADGGELSLIFKSYEIIKIKLDQKTTSVN